jgi:cytochrome c oxidase cbb3-type subunit III
LIKKFSFASGFSWQRKLYITQRIAFEDFPSVMISKNKIHFILVVHLLFLVVACNEGAKDAGVSSTATLPDSTLAGQNLFENNCSRCHGMDASGLTGPSLRRRRLLHAPDLAAFTSVVENGIQGTGMPSNWSFSDSECHLLYVYINSLRNQPREVVPGDTVAGRLVFLKSGCFNCHMLNGSGNSIGPDLSDIGARRNAAYLRQSLTDPGAALPESTDPDNGYGFSLYLPVKVVTKEGKEITGLRVNEDTYTIQLKDVNNNFYSFNKDSLRSVEKEFGQSLMPSFKNVLSDTQIQNLVSYLHNLGNQ